MEGQGVREAERWGYLHPELGLWTIRIGSTVGWVWNGWCDTIHSHGRARRSKESDSQILLIARRRVFNPLISRGWRDLLTELDILSHAEIATLSVKHIMHMKVQKTLLIFFSSTLWILVWPIFTQRPYSHMLCLQVWNFSRSTYYHAEYIIFLLSTLASTYFYLPIDEEEDADIESYERKYLTWVAEPSGPSTASLPLSCAPPEPLPKSEKTKNSLVKEILQINNLYEILGVVKSPSLDRMTLRRAYLSRSRACHPECVTNSLLLLWTKKIPQQISKQPRCDMRIPKGCCGIRYSDIWQPFSVVYL